MKDNSNPPSLFDCLDMFAHQKEEMCNVPRADEPVPEWALRGLDAKGRNLLKLLCPEFRVGDVAGLTRENLSGRRGYGKSSVDAVMALVDACRDGSVWTPRGIFVVHANEVEFGLLNAV